MTTTPAITPAGLQTPSAVETLADLGEGFKGIYGVSIGANPDGTVPAATSIGQMIALISDYESSRDEFFQSLYAAFDITQATTPALQILCLLTGTVQKLAAHSSVIVTCVGSIGTVLPVNRVLTVIGASSRFDSATPATLAAISATWAVNTIYPLNTILIANGAIWQCTSPGESANAGSGPSTTVTDNGVTWSIDSLVGATPTAPTWQQGTAYVVGDDVIANGWKWNCTGSGTSAGSGTGPNGYQTDNTVQWCYVAPSGTGVALVGFAAEQTGPIGAGALQLQLIATPITGWGLAFNALDATLGQSLETEPALRARQALELQAQGGGPPNSIRAAILALPTVEQCFVLVNNTNAPVSIDGSDVAAHGVEVIIEAPVIAPTTDAELALDVFNAVGAGTQTSGSTTVTVIDDSGNNQSVSFTRPSGVPIYITCYVYFDASKWPAGAAGIAAVEAGAQSALLTYGAGLQVGVDVRSSQLAGAIEDGPYLVTSDGTPQIAPPGSPSMPGILGVANGVPTDGTLPYIGTSATPVTSTTLAISIRQIATFATTHMVITALAATP